MKRKSTYRSGTVFYFFSAVFLLLNSLFAQNPHFTLLQGSNFPDSSYYNICKVNENEYWAVGKKGIITRFDKEGHSAALADLSSVKIPTSLRGADILNMAIMDEHNFLLCGDKGLVYHFDKEADNWDVLQVKGYENSCFYSICAIDENTAFICGGRSKIVNSKRVVPFGFILKTEDGGKSWEKVFRSVTKMVWSIKYDKKSREVIALLYTPVRSRLIASTDNGFSWIKKKDKLKGLFHDFYLQEGKLLLAGGKNGNFHRNGMVACGNEKKMFMNTGIFWDVEANDDIALASGTKGDLLYKSVSGDWQLVHTPVDNNLYEICFIDKKSAFVVGNNKLILKVDFK